MKFNKEDIGLYVAFGILGAGIGLVGGAVVAGYIRGRVQDEPIEEVEDVVFGESVEKTNPLDTEVWRAFNEKWEPTQIQAEMYRVGRVDLEDLETLILEQRANKATNTYSYNRIYREENKEPQPPLSDLVEEIPPEELEDIINDRFMIISDVVEEAPITRATTIYYDPEDNSWIKMSGRGTPIELSGIDEYIDTETWEAVLPLLLRGTNPIYVEDYDSQDRMYKFDLLPEDKETPGFSKLLR